MGEFSGFYLNLKRSLQESGADVRLISNRNDWKKLLGANELLYVDAEGDKIKRFYNRIIVPKLNKSKYKGYDVV